MKLEVGMYVRTKKGLIAKYIKINNKYEWHVFDNKIQWFYEYYRNEIDFDSWEDFIKEKVVKASHDIIDLIEVMDLMFIDISPDDCGGIVVPRIAETLDELERWKEHISNGYWILKGIVTKEQIESARYKVGE
jgi:hypothetical protein